MRVFEAHSGYTLNPPSCASYMTWIAQKVHVSPTSQILMTSRGDNFKFDDLRNDEDLFVFNRELLAENSDYLLDNSCELVEKAPELPFSNESSITALQTRVQWAKKVAKYATDMKSTINEEKNAIGVIQQAVAVAIANLNTQTKTVLQNVTTWEQSAIKELKEQDALLASFEPALQNLGKIEVNPRILDVTYLSDLIDLESVQSAKNKLFTSNEEFRSDITKASSMFVEIGKNTEDLKKKVALWTLKNTCLDSFDRISCIIEDILQTSSQVDKDFRDFYSQSQERKLKYQLCNEHISSLSTWSSNLYLNSESIMKMKLSLSRTALSHLQDLSHIQIKMIHLRNTVSELNQVNLHERNQTVIEEIENLPEAYGMLLIEYYRRTLWNDWLLNRATKISNDLDELNTLEESRRQKWVQQFKKSNSRIKAQGERTAITFSAESETAYRVTREEVVNYVQLLRSLGLGNQMLQRLNDAIQTAERESPENSTADFLNEDLQYRAFKSNPIRKPPDMTQIAREKVALEEQCKNHLSRIRNLEELLFKSEHLPTLYAIKNRPSNPYAGSLQPGEIESPTKVQLEKHVNIPITTPLSPQYQQELEKYTEEISSLKVELELKATSERMLNSRLLETDGVKNDLLKNLESQQADFVSERKDLHAQIDELVHRIEELEDEGKIEELEDLVCHLRGDNEELHVRVEELEEELESWRKDREVTFRLHQDQLEVGSKAISELKQAIKMGDDIAAAEANWHEEQLAVLRDRYGRLEESFLKLSKDQSNLEGLQDKMREELSSKDSGYNKLVTEYDLYKLEHLKMLSLSKQAVDQECLRRQDLEKELEKVVTRIRGLAAVTHLTDDIPVSLVLDSVEKVFNEHLQEIASLRSRNLSLREDCEKQLNLIHDSESSINLLQSRLSSRTVRAQDLTQRLYTFYARASELLVSLGFDVQKQHGIKGVTDVDGDRVLFTPDNTVLYWTNAADSEEEGEKFAHFLNMVKFDFDAFSEAVKSRVLEAEHMARKWQKESKSYREKANKARDEAWDKVAYRNFAKDDLALFLPTRNNNGQKPWAAFNQNCPHYFLKEEESHHLESREFLLARITNLEDYIIDSPDNNPCNLPDGTKWHLLEAVEEKGSGSARRRRKAALLTSSTTVHNPPSSPKEQG